MRISLYFIIFSFIISCSSNKGVYWCGDHACKNVKEKEAYFKKTMIVEVRNLDKNHTEKISLNDMIINQSDTEKKKINIKKKKLDKEIIFETEQREKIEREIEEQIEIQEQILLQEQKSANQEKIIKEKNNLDKKQGLSDGNKELKIVSTSSKTTKYKEISSMNFDAVVEKILIRNSTRSYPKINDIPK